MRLQLLIEKHSLPPLRTAGRVERLIVQAPGDGSLQTPNASLHIFIDSRNVGFSYHTDDLLMLRLRSCRAVLRARYPDAVLVWFIYEARLLNPSAKEAVRDLTKTDKKVIVPRQVDCDTPMLALAAFMRSSVIFVTNDRFGDHGDFLRRFAPTRRVETVAFVEFSTWFVLLQFAGLTVAGIVHRSWKGFFFKAVLALTRR